MSNHGTRESDTGMSGQCKKGRYRDSEKLLYPYYGRNVRGRQYHNSHSFPCLVMSVLTVTSEVIEPSERFTTGSIRTCNQVRASVCLQMSS
jgi:hypothetical protein